MGKKFNLGSRKINGQPAGSNEGTGAAGNGTGAEGTRSPGAGTGTGAGTGAPGNSGSTGAAGKAEEKKVSGLAAVKDAPAIVAADEAKPAETKPAPKKPRKVSKKKKAEDPTLPADQLDALIVSMAAIVAARPNCAHWAISESEAHSVSVPLCNILNKSGLLSAVNENADAVALAMAAVTIIVPRAMISVAMTKEKKAHERTGNTTNVSVPADKPKRAAETNRPAVSDGDGNQRERPRNVPGDFPGLDALGPVVAG